MSRHAANFFQNFDKCFTYNPGQNPVKSWWNILIKSLIPDTARSQNEDHGRCLIRNWSIIKILPFPHTIYGEFLGMRLFNVVKLRTWPELLLTNRYQWSFGDDFFHFMNKFPFTNKWNTGWTKLCLGKFWASGVMIGPAHPALQGGCQNSTLAMADRKKSLEV